jgi:hypothetical protein
VQSTVAAYASLIEEALTEDEEERAQARSLKDGEERRRGEGICEKLDAGVCIYKIVKKKIIKSKYEKS